MATTRRKFEDELKDLEGIVAQIDSGELSLEDSITAFERGVGLVRSLNQKLDEVERKVELLMRNAQGELKTTPYDPAAAARAEGGHKENDRKKDDEDVPF
ncbi:MAG TPA: exodeoxyribonuclease VII small subunit [Candidatus Binataceae bacterium]|nr:exodeoxyribonuclease VII small subunit [Candidatus Binataceae bacterium]